MNNTAVLYVEDDTNARQELEEFIGNNYPVVTAASGVEAIEIAQTSTIGVLLTDILMDPPDGIDAARAIQKIQPDVRIAFVTAYSDDPVYRQRVDEYGLNVAEWIDKPLLGNARERLLIIIEREINLRLMFAMVREWDDRRRTLAKGLAAAEAIASDLGIEIGSVRALREHIGASCSREQVIMELLEALERVRDNLDEIEERQSRFDHLKETALSRLRERCFDVDQDTRRMALLIRMAVRQMRGLELTDEQLDALEYSLEKSRKGEVETRDRRDCRRRFSLVGIQTMITLGPRTRELIEIYDGYEEDEEELP